MAEPPHSSSKGPPTSTASADQPPTPEEIDAARAALSALQTAVKNFPLYPREHAISEKLVTTTLDAMAFHFNQRGSLTLHVQKEGFVYRDQELAGATPTDLLGPPLRRDGVEWLQFDKGLTPHELGFFLDIVNQYRSLTSEPDGDLVTCLWKEKLPHIKYHAAEIFLETTPPFDFSRFKPSAASGPGDRAPSKAGGRTAGETESKGTGEGDHGPDGAAHKRGHTGLGLAARKNESHLITISEGEKRTLRELVIAEESWDNTEDVIDVLLIILADQSHQADFEALLQVIQAEFRETLSRGEFKYAHRLLQRLKKGAPRFRFQGSPDLINRFRLDISNEDTLGALTNALPGLKGDDQERIGYLKRTLTQLHPQAIIALAPLVPLNPSGAVQKSILEAAGHLATKDFAPLEQAVSGAESAVVRKLLLILARIKGPKPMGTLFRLTRHPEEDVRRDAVKLLLKRDSGALTKLYDRVEDDSPEIRRLLLQHLGHHRDGQNEKWLLRYLSEKEFRLKDDEHLLQCYRALGRCGAAPSLPFLKETLTARPFIDILRSGGSVHRRGAAQALALINLPESKQVLARAVKSIFPNIRGAAQAIRREGSAQ